MSDRRFEKDLIRKLEETEQSLRDRTFELKVLHELSSKIGASLTYDELFRAVLMHLGKAIAFDVAAGLVVTRRDCCHLYFRCVRPLLDSMRTEVENRLLSAFRRLSQVVIEPEMIQFTGVEETEPNAELEPLSALGSFFLVPIMAGAEAEAVGILLVGSETAEQFTEEHIRLLYTVAGQAAGAVQRMQDHLGTERRRLQAVVDHLPVGLALLVDGRRLALANPSAQRYLAELAKVEVGQALNELGGVPFADFTRLSALDVVTPGSQEKTIAVTVVPLEGDTGEPWLVVLQDVTEVREAVRRRDRFLAMLSHELRNPLAALTNAAQILHMPEAGETDRRDAREVIVRQLQHATRLVDDLLDLSRFLHGKIHVRKQPVDLTATVDDAILAQRPAFEAEGKRLDVEIAVRPLFVFGDPARLTQVLDNLLNNARKFTPEGSRVLVICDRDGPSAAIRIRDHGLGIAKDKQDTIFEPFMQVEEDPDHSQGGLGLGLALVKVLVTLHGGSIAVASDGPGFGSEFVVRLPVLHEHAVEETAAGRPLERGQRRRILIVEDQQDIRRSFQLVLELWGHQVIAASTGVDGVEAFRTHAPDVAFVDIGLPGMDGYQVARAIREESAGREAHLIALSGFALPEDQKRSREAGFDLHMAKPVNLDSLEELLGDCSQDGAAGSSL